MSNFQELNEFLSENVNSIITSIQKEAAETGSPVLKQYISMLHDTQAHVAQLHSELLANDSTPEEAAHKSYLKLFNFITDIIGEMDAEQETFIGKKYMLALKNLQIQAEERYLEQD